MRKLKPSFSPDCSKRRMDTRAASWVQHKERVYESVVCKNEIQTGSEYHNDKSMLCDSFKAAPHGAAAGRATLPLCHPRHAPSCCQPLCPRKMLPPLRIPPRCQPPPRHRLPPPPRAPQSKGRRARGSQSPRRCCRQATCPARGEVGGSAARTRGRSFAAGHRQAGKSTNWQLRP